MEDLPDQFNERVRPDIIKRAHLSIKSKKKQPYGADPESGLKHVTRWKKRNNAYRTQKGRGQSRTPRKIMLGRGSQLFGEGAEAPNTRGGRRAHPPKAQKDEEEEVNDKERRKAIRSAIAASNDLELIQEKHDYSGDLPVVEDIQDIERTQELQEQLKSLGLEDELERCSERKIRAGKGTMRGRKYKTKTGPLIVVEEDKGVRKAVSNLPGVEVSLVENLNAEKLAPGAEPGRLIVWDPNALDKMQDQELFY